MPLMSLATSMAPPTQRVSRPQMAEPGSLPSTEDGVGGGDETCSHLPVSPQSLLTLPGTQWVRDKCSLKPLS